MKIWKRGINCARFYGTYSVKKFLSNQTDKNKQDMKKALINCEEVEKEFIAYDFYGVNNDYERFTHIPSGDTLIPQQYIKHSDWNKAKLTWFGKYLNLDIELLFPTVPHRLSVERNHIMEY